jgi:hypothetical protein
MPSHEVFELGEPSQSLGHLHLEPDEEPMRRGAASRANSVRFDDSANWAQSTRHSGEFGPIRPSSGLAMERSLSHKSDGRHSSAGHSVHSNYSVASGRGSSLALETHLMFGGHEADSPLEIPDPAPSLFVLGSVPAIIRCWLTNDFANDTLLYAALCSGAPRSSLDRSLVEELGLLNDVLRELDGAYRIRLPVYLAEAIVSHSSSRSPNPTPQIPSLLVTFEVAGINAAVEGEGKGRIRIFIGSDSLRAHNADLLFSRNQMTLYGHDRDKLAVPFVRPENDGSFKYLSTAHTVPERPRLNATAAEFVSADPNKTDADEEAGREGGLLLAENRDQPLTSPSTTEAAPTVSEGSGESEKAPRDSTSSDQSGKDLAATPDGARRDASAIWGSWRQGGSSGGVEGGRNDGGPLSGYQPAGRGRAMKVLKSRSGVSTSARTGASYEPATAQAGSEQRRRSQGATPGNVENAVPSNTIRWESKRSLNSGGSSAGAAGSTGKENSKSQGHDARSATVVPRSTNPVGGASAFAWMNPGVKPKPSTAAAD